MSIGTLQMDGQKFRVIPEAENKLLRAAVRQQELDAKQDAAELTEANRRLKDPKRKSK